MKQIETESKHTVANLAYSNDIDWRDILDFNPELSVFATLKAGKKLSIPEAIDLAKPPALVFGALTDARQKLIKLNLGSYKTEAALAKEIPDYLPSDEQIADISHLTKVESVSNDYRERLDLRRNQPVVNWTGI